MGDTWRVIALYCCCTLGVNGVQRTAHRTTTADSSILELKAAPFAIEVNGSGHAIAKPALTVKLMGGLGNQLFQVATLLSLAWENSPHYAVALPDGRQVSFNRSSYWNSTLQGLEPLLLHGLNADDVSGHPTAGADIDHRCVLQQAPGFDANDKNCSHASTYDATWTTALKSRMSSCTTIQLYGYFQNPAFFADHLPSLRHALFGKGVHQGSPSATNASKRMSDMMPTGMSNPLVVSVHYRLGDYADNGWVLDTDYYSRAIEEIQHRFPKHQLVCYIFSDEPKRAQARSAGLQGCNRMVLVEEESATSFHMMRMAPASVIADSTYSYWAALLGEGKKIVAAPLLNSSSEQCWSYLQGGQAKLLEAAEWVAVPASTLSPGELLTQEVLGDFTPPED